MLPGMLPAPAVAVARKEGITKRNKGLGKEGKTRNKGLNKKFYRSIGFLPGLSGRKGRPQTRELGRNENKGTNNKQI